MRTGVRRDTVEVLDPLSVLGDDRAHGTHPRGDDRLFPAGEDRVHEVVVSRLEGGDLVPLDVLVDELDVPWEIDRAHELHAGGHTRQLEPGEPDLGDLVFLVDRGVLRGPAPGREEHRIAPELELHRVHPGFPSGLDQLVRFLDIPIVAGPSLCYHESPHTGLLANNAIISSWVILGAMSELYRVAILYTSFSWPHVGRCGWMKNRPSS